MKIPGASDSTVPAIPLKTILAVARFVYVTDSFVHERGISLKELSTTRANIVSRIGILMPQ